MCATAVIPGDDRRALRGGDGTGENSIAFAGKRGDESAAFQIPEPEHLVHRAGDRVVPIRCDCSRDDLGRVPLQRALQRAARRCERRRERPQSHDAAPLMRLPQ